MGIKEDFKVYSDQFGLTQAEPGSTSGNGLLYTAEYVAALLSNGMIDDAERDRLIKVFESCEIKPGLMCRAPSKDDQEGPDDYVGVGFVARFLPHSNMAQRVVLYGEMGVDEYDPAVEDEGKRVLSRIVFDTHAVWGLNVKNVWNNSNPGKFTLSAWLGRQQHLMAHLKFGAHITPNIFEQGMWCISRVLSMFASANNHDSWILGWMMAKTAEDRSFVCSIIAKLWLWRFKKKWPGGLGQLLALYFNNPMHPCAVWLTGVH